MLQINDAEFEALVTEAIVAIPDPYRQKLENVAFLIEDLPTPEQKLKLNLYPYETLFGLYEGVPLPQRSGLTKLLPDKITLFKEPLLAASSTIDELKKQIGRTLWHEVAHYYGLDHKRIHKLENRPK